MKEIKFTTNYEPVLSFSDKGFKTKYEERVGNNPGQDTDRSTAASASE